MRREALCCNHSSLSAIANMILVIHIRDKQNNVVIELNALKIAENRTFADCARYMLTTLLGLALPAPRRTPAEYASLYKQGRFMLEQL